MGSLVVKSLIVVTEYKERPFGEWSWATRTRGCSSLPTTSTTTEVVGYKQKMPFKQERGY